MKSIIFTLLVMFLAAMMIGGCSKDEEVAELEQQIKGADLLTDSTTEGTTQETAEVAEEGYEMTPEAAPAEESAATYMPEHPGGKYTVQISAGGNPEWVKYMADTYIRRGYDAFITEAIIDDNTFYRLRIGSYDSFAEAEAAGLEMKDKYSVDFWIDYNN